MEEDYEGKVKMIEVEVRGKIKDFENISTEFKRKAKFIKEKKRLSFIYFRDFVEDARDVKEEKIDLRARITNKKAEIVMKYGAWGGSDSRKEISLPIELEKFEEAIDFLNCLDWNKGVIIATETFVFDYNGIEFALVKNKHFSYFEAEKMVKDKEEINKTNKEILESCKEFKLEPFTEGEFMEQINTLNNIKENQFDFSKQDFSIFKEKFKEYF